MKIFLAGEGVTELGDWVHLPQYRPEPPNPGCLEALLTKVKPAGWSIESAKQWKSITKYKSGDHRKPEERNLRGLALQAWEQGCDALVFVRDEDGDPDRSQSISSGMAESRAAYPELALVGGLAVRDIEAWILACKGERGSEALTDAKAALAAKHNVETTQHKTDCISEADLDALPPDAHSLRAWLDQARALFSKM